MVETFTYPLYVARLCSGLFQAVSLSISTSIRLYFFTSISPRPRSILVQAVRVCFLSSRALHLSVSFKHITPIFILIIVRWIIPFLAVVFTTRVPHSAAVIYKHYQKMLKDKGIRQSMSRKGNCLDNACAENFFGLLKTELLYLQEFTSIEHFISELHAYIDWYNTKRIKLKLNGMSPVDYRLAAA